MSGPGDFDPSAKFLSTSCESIVTQEIAEVGADIQAWFQETGSDTATFPQAVEILRTSRASFVLALDDAGLYDRLSIRTFQYYRGKGVYKTQLQYVLTQKEMELLNTHPFIRTIGVVEASHILDVSVKMLRETAKRLDITPVITTASDVWRVSKSSSYYQKYYKKHGWEYYNKDQVIKINEGLSVYHAPDEMVSESALLKTTGLSPVALKAICTRAGISPDAFFHNPAVGYTELHFTQQEAVKVIRDLIKQKIKQKNKD